MENNILVSCTVLTYNSASTVIETLESIKNQTYDNIELIISDDCSKDNTIELCRDWIDKNNKRFVRTELLEVSQNTGVSSNGNRALAACQGEWQKGIAADDILFPSCVEDFVDFVSKDSNIVWASSFVREYHINFEEKNCRGEKMSYSRGFFDNDVEGQLQIMARRNLIYAPSLFYNVSVKKELGGYDTHYRIEDYPLYMKFLEHGYKCYFMDKETVGYRIHESLAHSDRVLFNYKNQLEVREYWKNLSFKYLKEREKFGLSLLWQTQDFIEKKGVNYQKNWLAKTVYNVVKYVVYHFLMSYVGK